MAIQILPPEVVSQIAAGEVVERPASVVKELVENSIDAGAGEIEIEIEHGGRRLIRVRDDGCGIPAAEVALAFQRHSTSKLSDVGDLGRITTLGFRGEALASIAAVSRVTCVTRAAGEEIGTLLRVEGGEVLAHRATGRPPGTTVSVEALFYNVPARRKFLRSEATERRHIDAWVTRYALAYPNLRFVLIHDGRETFHSPGNGDLREAFIAVYGATLGAALLEIPEDAGGSPSLTVRGFVSPPALHRANRAGITLFVNGRWVQDSRLTYAVIQAYHTFLPVGRYPLAVVFISIAPQEVDINVHPAKAEVRFADGEAVFQAVQRAVRLALTGNAGQVSARMPLRAIPQSRPYGVRRDEYEGYARELPVLHSEPPAGLTAVPPAKVPMLRVVGQIGATYIIAEGPDGLYLIDQHAAHERVLYERLMAQREEGAPTQRLLEPAAVDLPLETAGLVAAHQETLYRLGFDLQPFGRGAFLVRALPAILTQAEPAQVLADVAEALEEGRSRLEEEIEQAVMRQVCKQAAVKAGQILSREEMEGLVHALERCANPRTCPHGRPTMIHISVAQLAREFGRE